MSEFSRASPEVSCTDKSAVKTIPDTVNNLTLTSREALASFSSQCQADLPTAQNTESIPCMSETLDAGPETVDGLAYKEQPAVKTASADDVMSSDEALGSAFKASASPQLSIPPGTAQYPSISNTLDAVPAGLETFQSQRRG